MPEKYTKKQLWKLYQKLPEELKEAMWSDETADAIWDVCQRNGVDRKIVPKITEFVGYVLLGILPPDNFQKTLEKEVGLKKAVSKKVAQEIHRHIFFPVRTVLAELYRVEIGAVPAKPSAPTAAAVGAEPAPKAPAEGTQAPRTKEKPKGPDVYREPIE